MVKIDRFCCPFALRACTLSFNWKKAAAASGAILFTGLTFLGIKNWMAAEQFRQIGNQVLNKAATGSFAKERLCFPINTQLDGNYIRDLQLRGQSPDLCEYVKFQIDNGYYNGLKPEILQKLMPGKETLTDSETRKLYNWHLKETIPCLAVSLKEHPLRNEECYDIMLAASETRNHLKKDARIRSKETPGLIWEIINKFRYGGEVDFEQLVGKYWLGSVAESCAALFNATIRTNAMINKIAGV